MSKINELLESASTLGCPSEIIDDVIQIACALIAEGQTEHDIVGVKAAKIIKSIYKELAK